jgi:hypothetical protein
MRNSPAWRAFRLSAWPGRNLQNMPDGRLCWLEKTVMVGSEKIWLQGRGLE